MWSGGGFRSFDWSQLCVVHAWQPRWGLVVAGGTEYEPVRGVAWAAKGGNSVAAHLKGFNRRHMMV